ncbi:cytidine deaminase [Rhodococcus sp. HNM0569]|nr:cytidine deaminase [Rhodococcus sp. HNM0569]
MAESGPGPLDSTGALDTEDSKLVVLARGALGRSGGTQGAAVRDLDGRTYAAGAVRLDALTLTALQGAVAAALSSGAQGFEAAVVIGADRDDPGVAALQEKSPNAAVHVARVDGTVVESGAGE